MPHTPCQSVRLFTHCNHWETQADEVTTILNAADFCTKRKRKFQKISNKLQDQAQKYHMSLPYRTHRPRTGCIAQSQTTYLASSRPWVEYCKGNSVLPGKKKEKKKIQRPQLGLRLHSTIGIQEVQSNLCPQVRKMKYLEDSTIDQKCRVDLADADLNPRMLGQWIIPASWYSEPCLPHFKLKRKSSMVRYLSRIIGSQNNPLCHSPTIYITEEGGWGRGREERGGRGGGEKKESVGQCNEIG